MAIKYRIQYKDIEQVSHVINISADDYTGDITNVQGRAVFEYNQTDDILEPIRGMGLSVELEANQDLDFSDLYSEQEQTYKVEYYRDSQILFSGFLNSEGYYEDLVNDFWKVTFTALDGVGFLENLSFVDESGIPFSGLMSEIEILRRALNRSKILKSIEANVRINYLGMDTSKCVLEEVYNITDRFYKDDEKSTLMSCKEVIDSILEPYGAVLISCGDKWVIERPRDKARFDNQLYHVWDSNGNYQGADIRTYWNTLGSESQGFYPHYANSNLKREFRASLGAYRVNYKYGLRQSLIANPNLFNENGLYPDWTLAGNNDVIPDPNGVKLLADSDQGVTIKTEITSDAVQNLSKDISYNLLFNYVVGETTIGEYFGGTGRFRVVFSGGGSTYYLNNNGAWQTSATAFSFAYFAFSGTIGFEELQLTPTDGQLYVEILTPTAEEYPLEDQQGNTTFERSAHFITFTQVTLSIANEELSKEGEFHTAQRTTNPNPKIDKVKEVYVADGKGEYLGTKYKVDKSTPTEFWTRQGFSEQKPLLQIMVEERLRISQLPSGVISGDFYGYIDYLNYYAFNGLSGRYQITKISYDTKDNISQVEASQIFDGEVSDIEYDLTFDYGKVIEPTIKS